MSQIKDITTEKGFELAELAVSLFSGVLFIYFADKQLFLSLDVWKLMFFTVGIILPLFIVVKLLLHIEVLFKDQERLRDEAQKMLSDEYSGERLNIEVEKILKKHMNELAIKMASTGVSVSVIIVSFSNYFWHWNIEKSIMALYALVIIVTGFTTFIEYCRDVKSKKKNNEK